MSWILVSSFIPVIVTEHLFCARGKLLGAGFSGRWERKDPTFGELVCTAVDEANNKNVNLSARYVSHTDFSYRNRTVKGDDHHKMLFPLPPLCHVHLWVTTECLDTDSPDHAYYD